MDTESAGIVDGVPVGRDLAANPEPGKDGSIIIVIATDAPLLPHQLRRLCLRSAFGVTRTGTVSRTSSGDFALAFSTAQKFNRDRKKDGDKRFLVVDRVETLEDDHLTSFFQAVIEATEEAVINAMFVSEAMTGRDNYHIPALPIRRVLESLKMAGRIR